MRIRTYTNRSRIPFKRSRMPGDVFLLSGNGLIAERVLKSLNRA
jgi:hypothetical protein